MFLWWGIHFLLSISKWKACCVLFTGRTGKEWAAWKRWVTRKRRGAWASWEDGTVSTKVYKSCLYLRFALWQKRSQLNSKQNTARLNVLMYLWNSSWPARPHHGSQTILDLPNICAFDIIGNPSGECNSIVWLCDGHNHWPKIGNLRSGSHCYCESWIYCTVYKNPATDSTCH